MCDPGNIKENLNGILKSVAEKLNIENYELVPDETGNYGDGFASHFYTGQVKNKDTGKIINVAIKKSPSSKEVDFSGLFRSEIAFYKEVFPRLSSLQKEHPTLSKPFVNIPEYFCSQPPPLTYIAMENLQPLGYTMYDKAKTLDPSHLKLIFTVYGRFHACSFVLKEQNPEGYKELTDKIVDEFSKLLNIVIAQIESSFKGAFRNVHEETEKDLYEKTKNIPDNIKEVFLKAYNYDGKFDCIIHGDCWSNNMLFKYTCENELEDLKLIDFQLLRTSTPVHDLSSIFYSGASKKDFDKLTEYLQVYYKSFEETCKGMGVDAHKIFPFEKLIEEWKKNALFGVLMGIYLWNMKLLPKERFQFLVKDPDMPKEKKKQIWKDMMEEMYRSEGYQEKTKAILVHAVEFGILDWVQTIAHLKVTGFNYISLLG